MQQRYEVRLNGINLTDLSDDLMITDVNQPDPEQTLRSTARGYADGSYFQGVTRDSLTVEVTFALWKYDVANRQRLYSRVAEWAKAGYLTLNDRHGQRLYVDYVQVKGLGSVKGWTNTVSVTLYAFSRPWWEQESPAAISKESTGNASLSLYVPGDAPSCNAEVEIKAKAAISTVILSANGKSLTFSNLGLKSGQTFLLSHTDTGLLTAAASGASVLAKRTGDDDLILYPGKENSIQIQTGAACTATARTRGGWR